MKFTLLQNIKNWIFRLFTDQKSLPPQPVSTFDPKSERARKGIAFQEGVFQSLLKQFPDHEMIMTWDYFKAKEPDLSDYSLACLEKEYGDITFVLDGQRFWVECCLAMGKNFTYFCEMKRIKFQGLNKWYCWGKVSDEDMQLFVPSSPWNRYVSKCDLIRRGKRRFRKVSVSYIGSNLRVGKSGVTNFAKFIS